MCNVVKKPTSVPFVFSERTVSEAIASDRTTLTLSPAKVTSTSRLCLGGPQKEDDWKKAKVAGNCRTHKMAIQYNTIQYNTIQYNTIQYNTILYNTI